MRMNRSNVTERREDFSRFVVHLTRNNRGDFPRTGNTARNNFLSILERQKIGAYRPHCLHSSRLDDLPAEIRRAFKVACFTEVPLSQLRFLTQPIAGRK